MVDNLAELLQKSTLDVVGDSAFGWEFNAMQGNTSSNVAAIQYIIAILFSLPYNLKRRDYILDAKMDPSLHSCQRLSDQEVKDNLKLFLSLGMKLLAQYPDMQEEIHKDLANGNVEPLEYFFLETMRLYSPVVSRICIKDCDLGGYHAPKGTVVGVSVHGIQQSESNWTEPEKFTKEME